MAIAKLMTAGELAEAMIGLTEKGVIVPVWDAECGEMAFWPAGQAPADAKPMSADEVRAYFDRIAGRIFPALS